MPSKSEIYRKAFGLDPSRPEVTREALAHALDIRKFEIGLYWQRATYFWTLIAAAFAGYFAVLAADKISDKEFNAFVIASIGFVFSVAWNLANRGSKFWQENWENHVDMLEDEIAGPLYKTVLRRPRATHFVERWIDGPLPISVSKINQWASLFTVLIWGVLACNVLPAFSRSSQVSVKHVVVAILAIGVCFCMAGLASTHLGDHKHSLIEKRTAVIDEDG